jgi:hypothetical protein
MIKRTLAAAAALALLLPAAAMAELPQGTAAPDFTTQGALAGKPMDVNLKALLAKGPVVLYFYPKAFTQGCTIECKSLAEHGDLIRKYDVKYFMASVDPLDGEKGAKVRTTKIQAPRERHRHQQNRVMDSHRGSLG